MKVAAWPSDRLSGRTITRFAATTASLANPPNPTLANTRVPTAIPSTSGATSVTRPTTSIPGTNGVGGLI